MLDTCMYRSVTMDAWSPDQLRKMQLGGNDTLNNFLGKYSVDKFTEIKDKYNSQAAEVSLLVQFIQQCATPFQDVLHVFGMGCIYDFFRVILSVPAKCCTCLSAFRCMIDIGKAQLSEVRHTAL